MGGRCYLPPLVCSSRSVLCPIRYSLCDQLLAGALFVIYVSAYAVRPNVSEGLGGVEASLGLGISRRAYLKSLTLVPSSHCGSCMLILCVGNLDPPDAPVCGPYQSYGNPTVDVSAHPGVGLPPLFRRRLAILFRVSTASTPSSPSTEVTNGEKCWRWWRHASGYIFWYF